MPPGVNHDRQMRYSVDSPLDQVVESTQSPFGYETAAQDVSSQYRQNLGVKDFGSYQARTIKQL